MSVLTDGQIGNVHPGNADPNFGKPSGTIAKALAFAKENPVVAVLAALFVLGLVSPARSRK